MACALRHNIDHLLQREGQIFSYGWGFHPGRVIVRVVLKLEFHTGDPVEVDADYGRPREDVKVFFPNIPEAQHAGFLLMASDSRAVRRAVLRWEMREGAIETPLDLAPQERRVARTATHYGALLGKGIALLRSDGVAALWRKARGYVHARPKRASDEELARPAHSLSGRDVAIVVDHDMGGGANIYRRAHIGQRRNRDETVVLLSFHLASLQYFVEVIDGNVARRHSIESPERLLAVTARAHVRHLLYNCAVSFREPLAVIDMLIALQQQSGARIEVAIHDYFAICPTAFLIDHRGEFCGVPDLGHCNRCLPAHRDGFVSIAGIKDLQLWRRQWARLLAAAHEVRLFSESSRRMLARAYPAASTASWRVVPHVLHTAMPTVLPDAGERLHIGIVGAIGKYKGAGVVARLAEEIARRDTKEKITVIGTLDARTPAGVVSVTGPYAPENLAGLIRGSGANVFLFPSVMAETYSYVAHELVAMGLPFACFDFGAPADLAQTYDKGIVLDSLAPDRVLDRLQSFWRATYAEHHAPHAPRMP